MENENLDQNNNSQIGTNNNVVENTNPTPETMHKKSKLKNMLASIVFILLTVIILFILIKIPNGKNTGSENLDIIKSLKTESDVEKAKNQANIPDQKITPADHYMGNMDARIVVVEYSDLDCPYCARFHPTMKKLVSEYPNDILWVYRHLPLDNLHKNARLEAIVSECVAKIDGEKAFWEFLDSAFAFNSSALDDPTDILKNLSGVDKTKLEDCLNNSGTIKNINQKINAGENIGSSSGAQGTPYSIFMDKKNGAIYPVPGAQEIETLREIIKTILSDTK